MTDLTVQYTQRELIDALRQTQRPTSFLLDRLVRATNFTDRAYLEIDIVKGTKTIAPYVSRKGEPTKVGKKGYDTLIHLAPYVYDESTLTPSDADTRLPGNTIYGGTSAGNVDAAVANLMAEMSDRMDRREEQQLAQALLTGKCTVLGSDVNYEIDYQMDAGHIITLTAGDVWGSTTEDKLAQFEAWSQLIMQKGIGMPTECYMSLTAWQLLRADTAITALLDNRRIQMGEINPRQIADQNASYQGTLSGAGLNIDIYVYQAEYTNESGTDTKYIPDDYLVLVTPGIKIEKHYTKIENFKSLNMTAARFPNMWDSQNGKFKYMSMESGPLAALHQPDGVVSVKVK